MKKKFRRHFRIYLVNGHPAYIVDEEGDYMFFIASPIQKLLVEEKPGQNKTPLNKEAKSCIL